MTKCQNGRASDFGERERKRREGEKVKQKG